jgi:hypothetical protein
MKPVKRKEEEVLEGAVHRKRPAPDGGPNGDATPKEGSLVVKFVTMTAGCCEFVTMRSPTATSPASCKLCYNEVSVNSGPSHPHDDPGAQTMPHH